MNVRDKYASGIAAAKRVIQATPDLKECQDKLWLIVDEVGTILENGEINSNGADSNASLESLESTRLLLSNCFADVVSAANCLDQGIPHSAAIILRPIAECIGVSVAIADKNLFEIYKNKPNDFNAPKAVSKAKEIFPQLGPHYGVLTKLATHPGYETLGRALYEQNEATFLALLPPVEYKDGQYQTLITASVAMTALMIGEAYELRFSHTLKNLTYFKREGDSLITERTAPGIQALLKITSILERKLGGSQPRKK